MFDLHASVLFIAGALVVAGYSFYRKMPKAGSFLFRIGYTLYSRTPVGYFYYQRELKKANVKYGNEQHSITQPSSFNGLQILPIAMSMDNYSYLVTDESSNICVLIDPADSQTVISVLERQNANLIAILTTHRHWDHSAGNADLKQKYKNIAVYGGEHDSVPNATHKVKDGERLQLGQLSFTAMWTPGHTAGHMVYYLDGSPFGAPSCLFTGDHIFLSGIGRMFECSAATMLESIDKVLNLPDETLIWPGHEYSEDNLHFAAHIQPDNDDVKIPSTLAEEKRYNPFMRVDEKSLQQTLAVKDSGQASHAETRAETLARCRLSKDKFKYKL